MNTETILQEQQDLLRFITCGSVDDGKSTLIGRLLWESKQLFDDQIITLKNESKKFGTQGGSIDFALLLDGLTAEREQGITIDVAYRFFTMKKRRFIVADTPGHEQYTRNMVTGASTADVAVLLLDARFGLMTQTRRHAYLVSLMGIRHIVLAINKMDLVNYSETVFLDISSAFTQFAITLNFESITAIPLSALKGDNISTRSEHTTWYNGVTFMHYLETIKASFLSKDCFVFPVQWVNRPNATFRGFSGSITEGAIQKGDEVRVSASGYTAKVTDIVTMDGNLKQAHKGQAVTLTLDREIDVSRGDILSLAKTPLESSDQFETTIIWMYEEECLIGRQYMLKLANQWVTSTITSIKYRIDPNTLNHENAKQLTLNDIAVVNIYSSKAIVFDRYNQSKSLGGFILVDRFTHATVAAGMINHGLRRAQNIYKQVLSITQQEREKLNGHKGKVIWFTGLSGSGKSTIANALEVELHALGQRTYILDGDNIRLGLNKDLGFTDADRVENIRRAIEVARLMLDCGLIVLITFISPFQRERLMAKEMVGKENFIEIYVDTPLEICEARDVKGLYRKARDGKLPNFSGISSLYEPPENPTLCVGRKTVNEVVSDIMRFL
ncbi:MAG: sulfate adenylyltransferase subunit CysN [Gammaproteobacteria bacterium]|nr:sulfate adenylyltransferase subunit CysN [Gammaproteobacteria bacterium]